MTKIDEDGLQLVEAALHRISAAGLTVEAELLSNAYWAWLRITEAYVNAHPYVAEPERGMTPISALHVVDVALTHWSALVPGSPVLNDAAVLEEAAIDADWHRQEDRRMRRASGEVE